LGIPVVLIQDDPREVRRLYHPPHGDFLPATAVIEFSDNPGGRAASARLAFYNPLNAPSVRVGERLLPLAENLTAPLQFALPDSTQDEEPKDRPAPSVSGEQESRLFFPAPYDRSKTPVVFIHGLRSGPVIWKNAINALLADPELRRHYQPVCFVYPSGLPIPTSAARLRQLLMESRGQLDPASRDPGFDKIVLVGHSMGGLVARMQVIDSGRDFWNAFFAASPSRIEREIDQPTRTMIRKSLLFHRLDNVKTVVFITTPHRGSEIADLGIVQAVAKFVVDLPSTTRQHLAGVQDLPPTLIHPSLRTFNDWGNTGVENLSTKHPYFEALARRPITVPFHSIIGIGSATDPQDASDGVVPFRSAHLPGAASESILPFPHGCVERQGTVDALLKILKDSL
jgi:triacylglycerol esterase/lipase EstA (alpha/beta hydrolase family)